MRNQNAIEMLGSCDTHYNCVIVNQAKPKMLKAKKYKVVCEAVRVKSFSVGKNGRQTPSGISFVVPTKVIGIE